MPVSLILARSLRLCHLICRHSCSALGHDKAQSIIDQITSAYESGGGPPPGGFGFGPQHLTPTGPGFAPPPGYGGPPGFGGSMPPATLPALHVYPNFTRTSAFSSTSRTWWPPTTWCNGSSGWPSLPASWDGSPSSWISRQ